MRAGKAPLMTIEADSRQTAWSCLRQSASSFYDNDNALLFGNGCQQMSLAQLFLSATTPVILLSK